MRTIKRATNFKKDYRRVKASPRHAQDVGGLLQPILVLLVNDAPLPENCRNHELAGNWTGYRECHIKPDLLLIYRTIGSDKLGLARLGSHSELFKK
jgi:mRNA interferase YafQ